MIELLGYSALSLMIVKLFTPLHSVRERIINFLIRTMVSRNWGWLQSVIIVLTCPMCFSFWATLLYTQDIWKATIVAVMTRLIDLTIEFLEDEHK
jgi:hypothetical protein